MKKHMDTLHTVCARVCVCMGMLMVSALCMMCMCTQSEEKNQILEKKTVHAQGQGQTHHTQIAECNCVKMFTLMYCILYVLFASHCVCVCVTVVCIFIVYVSHVVKQCN